MFWVLIVAAAAMGVAGVNIAMSWGMNPADGGVLKPLPERLAFGGGMVALALALLVGMGIYVARYVVSVRSLGGRLYIRTANLFGGAEREFDVNDVQALEFRSGKTVTYKANVNAPWKKMRIRGMKLPFIIDMQAEYIDRTGFEKLLARHR